MLTARPRGTNDIMPGDVEIWRYLEEQLRQICREYGYAEIRTPIFEHTELFLRGVGDATDIADKEMYTFTDRGERSITLRPEGTASAVRAYLENKLYAGPQPVKLYYAGPMFRYDRPQAGRYRQFHQCGVEVFGSSDPALDAEVITMCMDFYERIGLSDLELHINSVGCPNCRPQLHRLLQDFFRPRLPEICANCRDRYDKNPLRLLDCKICAGKFAADAPTTADCLCDDCLEHFASVKKHLDLLNLSYIEDHRLVRGLDYYTNTAFEIMAPDLGAQSSIGGGGRYNGLVEICGGPPTPGVGYALGLERIILTMQNQGCPLPEPAGLDVYLVTAGQEAAPKAFQLLLEMRRAGLAADKDYLNRSLKAQMKFAGKAKAKYTVIIGAEELARQTAIVRDMSAQEQTVVAMEEIISHILGGLKKNA